MAQSPPSDCPSLPVDRVLLSLRFKTKKGQILIPDWLKFDFILTYRLGYETISELKKKFKVMISFPLVFL